MEKRQTDLATALSLLIFHVPDELAGRQAVEASSKSFYERFFTFVKLGLNPDFPLGAPSVLFVY